MKNHHRTYFHHLIAVLLVLWPALLWAAGEQATPRAMTLDDALKWKKIHMPVISADGKWLAYQYSPGQYTPGEGDGVLIVRSVSGEKEYRFDTGEGSSAPAFSENGLWLAFATNPMQEQDKQLENSKGSAQKGVALVNLASGARVDYPGVKDFAFSGESSLTIALLRYGADGPPPAQGSAGARSASRGTHLILRNLSTAEELTIGGVTEFAFDKAGRWLAWTVGRDDQVGNGVGLRDLETGVVRTLDSDRARYEKLAWTEEGDALAVLKGTDNKLYDTSLYSVIGVADMAKTPFSIVQYDPAEDPTFPTGMRISPNRAPQWSGDRKALLFGIDEARKKVGEVTPATTRTAEDKPDVVIWHWRDSRLQTEQQAQEAREKSFSYLATWRVAERKFIRLADEAASEVTAPRKGRWALGIDSKAYELSRSMDGRGYQDAYVVDIESGARKLIGKRMRTFVPKFFKQSPDGSKVLYYADKHYYVFDAQTGRAVNITQGMPVSFVDVEDDHNLGDPPVEAVGWSADSRSVLLSDLWDLWLVPIDGGVATNLTGNGRSEQIRYRYVSVDREEQGIDFSKPQYFSLLGEWTKKGGYARLPPRQRKAEVLVWDAAAYGGLIKAKRAPTLVYTRSTSVTFPDLYAADAIFKGARRLSDGQAQLAGYRWSAGARLIDYQCDSPRPELQDKKLQASLFLPAGYEPGRSYPTIVYIYERFSDGMNKFEHPIDYTGGGGFNTTLYTSNGYAVLKPDISYAVNDVGMSAVWCVLPALKAAVASGVVDPARVGLHGHSFGGYQTTFLVTQTDAFKAAVAGAPLVDLVGAYGLTFKGSSGAAYSTWFESNQGRFRGGYWDNWDAYVRNSPIAHVQNVSTPLLILNNDKDEAVDFTQGLEYYNALRRLGKPVVMLEYRGERHSLYKAANKYDYSVRMREFFDHFLKGEAAPDWWMEGVPRLKMEEHLNARASSSN